jgi:uncharacterized cupin superfamily protein
MKIIHKQNAIQISKPEGLDIVYYLFNEYEIHYNKQKPNSTQVWHHHEKIWETIYIIDGELTAKWREGDTEKEEIIQAGDIVETERTPHSFTNDSGKTVIFLVFKQLPKGENIRHILKTDKVLD